jgi:CBS domain-containing protein
VNVAFVSFAFGGARFFTVTRVGLFSRGIAGSSSGNGDQWGFSLLKTRPARSVIHWSIGIFHSVERKSPMNAYELCQRHVVTVRRHEELGTAAWMMRERNVGCLVVVEPAGAFGGERPIGMLTDRDIVTNVIVRDADPRAVSVEDVMTRHPVTVSTHSTIEESLQRMREGHIRRVPVVDDRGCLTGILALDDIFEFLATRAHLFVTPIRRAGHPREQVSS